MMSEKLQLQFLFNYAFLVDNTVVSLLYPVELNLY